MRPVRKSSEGPEVVHPILSDKYAISERLERARVGRWTQYQKQVDPYQVETRNFPLSPPLPPSPMPSLPSNIVPDRVEKPRARRKTFGLITTIVLVLVAFLVGGGVGGGIGGSLVAKEKSKPRITYASFNPWSFLNFANRFLFQDIYHSSHSNFDCSGSSRHNNCTAGCSLLPLDT